MTRITRRQFIKGAAAGAAGLALAGSQPLLGAPEVMRRSTPNLLFIDVDQQHFQALSALGSKYVKTPNMDRLIKRGTTFTMSYSGNPVCCPARACWYTGLPSSRNGMLSNVHKINPDVPDLGQWLGARGYNPFYSGKWHVPGRNPRTSFTCLTADPTGLGEHADYVVSRSAQSFLKSYDGDKPFFLSLGFLQPHDCCYWVFSRPSEVVKLPYGLTEHDLPPLPDNYDYNLDEPPTLHKHMEGVRKWAARWPALQWRYYMWSYYRMVEMVDAEVGRVLDALQDSRFASDTLVILTSDHGDGLSRRKLVSKWTPYDEAARVPLTIAGPGVAQGKIDRDHVVSGLDIPATLCNYAGVASPPGGVGRSMRPLVEGTAAEWREFAVTQVNITGRMIRTPEYKLIAYKDESPEMLFDMRHDPWEMTNLASQARYADVVTNLKARLEGFEKGSG